MKALNFKRLMPLFTFFIMFAGARAEGDTISTWQWQKQYPTDFSAVQYSKTDKYIVATSASYLHFLDPTDGKEIYKIDTRKRYIGEEVRIVYGTICFINGDTQFLLESADRKTIDCYSTSDFKKLYSLDAVDDEILEFDVSRDEKQLVARVGVKGMKVWDLQSKKITAEYSMPKDTNTIAAWIAKPRFSPNGKEIIAKYYSKIKTDSSWTPPYYTSVEINKMAVFNQKLIIIDSLHTAWSINWSKSGNVFALFYDQVVNGKDHNIIEYHDANNYKMTKVFDTKEGGGVANMFFTNDEEYFVIAYGSDVNICKVFRIKDGVNTVNYHPGNSSSGANISNSGNEIIFCVDNYITKYKFSPTSSVSSSMFDNGMISYPNPIKGGGVLKFNQQKPGTTKIFISDEKGTIMKVISNTFYETGQQAVAIDASDLVNGAYFITVVNDTQNFTQKFIVSK